MTIIEYNKQVEERDTIALSIYHERGEKAYWDFMNANKIIEPKEFVKDAVAVEPVKREPYPHLFNDEKKLLNEAYYYDQHKPINISSF